MPSARVVSWRHRLRAAFTERLPQKGTALLLALALWVIVSTREETEESVPVRFAPDLDRALVLADEPPIIRARVRGLGREVLKLSQTPPVIRRAIAGDLPDTVQLDLRASDVDLPPGVDARVLDVRPRTVTLVFRPYVSRAVPVRPGVVVTPDASGRVAAALYVYPDSVTLVGRRRGVARVTALRTIEDTLPSVEGATRVVAIDTVGLGRLGVRVRPALVRVRVQRLAPAASAAVEAAPPRVVHPPRATVRVDADSPSTPAEALPSPTTGAPASPNAPARRDTTRVPPAPAPRDSAAPRRPVSPSGAPAARDTTRDPARDATRRDTTTSRPGATSGPHPSR